MQFPVRRIRQQQTQTTSHSVVTSIRFEGDDEKLLRSLKGGHPGAKQELYDRYSSLIYSMLVRVIGVDAELEDLLHEVFVQAFSCVHKVEQADKLKSWLISVAVFVAKGCIRRRKRQKWLHFFSPSDVPDVVEESYLDDENKEALICTYALLDKLSVNLRLVFTLKYMEGLKLKEIAEATNTSLATTKRYLSKAKNQFFILAQNQPELHHWLATGGYHE